MSIAITLHLLSAIIWIGGMFFAYVALRPVAASQLEPAQRLPLWAATFARFFPWVWLAVVLLPASGYWMVLGKMGGFGAVGGHIHAMTALGSIMIALFIYMFFAHYRRLRRHVAGQDWPAAGQALAGIRKIVAINLALGLIVATVAAYGRYYW